MNFTYDRVVGTVDRYKAVDIFPYKIRNNDNYIYRDHIPYREGDEESREYAQEIWRRCTEGFWIDDDGVAFWMPPKLYFYINLGTAVINTGGKTRKNSYPRLRDNELILFTYILCCDGFSGFAGDPDFTCHTGVRDIEAGLDPTNRVLTSNHCKKADGTWKKYVEAWDYLTWFYTVENPRGPLGKALYENESSNGMVLASRGTAKDLEENTVVHTPTGPVKIKDIQIGDSIFGADGKPTTVVAKQEFDDQLQYQVTLKDGRTIECGGGHRWTLYNHAGKRVTVELNDIKDSYLNIRKSGVADAKYFVPIAKPLKHTPKALGIDPYFLGLWLGDGSKHRVGITTVDVEIEDTCRRIAKEYGLNVAIASSGGTRCPTYFITAGKDKNKKEDLLLKAFKGYNLLNNKHIPSEYFYGSIEQRMSLLQGLMDSDGTIDKGGAIAFSTSSEVLLGEFCNLVGSLGIRYSIKEAEGGYIKDGIRKKTRTTYKVKLITSERVFRLPRKLARLNLNTEAFSEANRTKVAIVDIKPTEVKRSVCIAVDNKDKLFLAGDYVVTHNTYVLAGGDCAHEFWTNGAMSYEDLRDGGSTVDLFVGSSDTIYVTTFLETVGTCLDNIPGGQFKGDPNFKKSYTGTWDGAKREPIIQRYRQLDGTYKGSMSEILNAIILPNKAEVVVSKRVKRLYIDEVGLQGNVDAIYNAADSTMKDDTGKMGGFFFSGTGGNIDKITATKKMYTSTKHYNIYPIPNYWSDGSPIGLFIPASYRYAECKDPQGNTDVIKGTKHTLQDRLRLMEEEKTSLIARRQNEPLEPSEIYIAGKSDYFERDIIADRIEILEHGLQRQQGHVYDLQLGKYDPQSGLYEVYAEKKNEKWGNAIVDMDYKGRSGEIIVYEPPMHDGVGFLDYDNLYKVVYDPKSDITTGSSYGAIIVYKGLPKRGLKPGELFYNIVAEAKIKNDEEDHHIVFLLMCLWYKSKGQYERTVSGIPDFFNKYKLGWLLQAPPIEYMKGVVNTKQSQASGIVINEDFKDDGLKLFRKFHKKIVHIDSGNRMFKWIETIFSLSLLWEMNNFDREEGNFDMVSAMIILMLWLQSEHIPDDSAKSQEGEDYDAELNELAMAATRYMR